MKKEIAIKKNLELLNEFRKQAFDYPEVMDKIPPEAELVILPTDDKQMYDYNKKIADTMHSQGKTIVLVKLARPKQSIPKMELMLTGTGQWGNGGRPLIFK